MVAATFAAQGCAAVVLLVAFARSLARRYAVDYGEPVVLDIVRRLAAGQNVYRQTLASPPFVVTNYPPLFFAAQAPFTWTFGAAYWYGRLISEASALAAAALAGITVWNLTRHRVVAIAAGGAILCVPVIGT